MDIVVVGLNHKKTPIHVRESVSFSESQREKAYESLKKAHYIKEFVIISTCNRSEIVAVAKDIEKGTDELKNFYIDFFNLKEKNVASYFMTLYSDDAVKHVFNVAAGLDSLVIGEDQILGQFRNAHEYSRERKATDKVLNKLFLEAVTTAKKIKRETQISEKSLSISTIAVKFIEKKFEDLQSKKVLVIGVGKMSRIAIENLIYRGVEEIFVTNRTKGHATDLSTRYEKVGVVDFKDRYKMLPYVDIIISSTSAPHYVLKKDIFKDSYNADKQLCIIDIALPRDVDPQINDFQNVSLYELDELKSVADENFKARVEAAKMASQIIIEDCIKFENWYNCLPVFPIIKGLGEYSQEIVNRELEGLLSRLEHLGEKDLRQIELFTKGLAKKLFKRPIHELKRAGEDRQGELYSKVTKELFGLMDASCKKDIGG
ncbi:glutamyl-tRNA reductase [Paramaledivibacter caminithermalis]|jgi:glutamyl-tRNA reductase|uniref:Glutamyl-tRNA reductase n=1 Tax=Paramaledivibacter caminithermalis (strain DSM 15212 / CIP 107654 / DViRD3) TaxID=1121301 RepID=A0A1M6ML68_PARC5|nr:glutamyl-tRNA reductase [Paramaledivibacter caminithermalis]SHJ84199.1 glutamyl-tRNA reductase [Paramaledivibacter caminithermalis DSM 15212]